MRTRHLAIAFIALGVTFALFSIAIHLAAWMGDGFAGLSSGAQRLLGVLAPCLAGVFLGPAAVARSRRTKRERKWP